MKQQELFKKIGNIVKEINEQYEYLQQAGDLFNDLELELMAANAHFLSDHIEILRKIKKNAEQEQLPLAMPPPLGPAPIKPKLVEFKIEQTAKTQEWFTPETSTAAPKEEDNAPKPETIRHELTLDDIGEDWDEDDTIKETHIMPEPVAEKVIEPEINTPKPEPVPERIIEQEVVIPKPAPGPVAHTQILVEEQHVLTFNERIAASRVTEPAGSQPISDLKSAITLNDKLLYIKDLFNGYSLAYSEALDILNRFSTFEEAESFLKASYALKNNWADKETTASKFYTLLRRRYTK